MIFIKHIDVWDLFLMILKTRTMMGLNVVIFNIKKFHLITEYVLIGEVCVYMFFI